MEKIESSINKINRSIVGKEEIKRVIRVLKSGLLSRPAGGLVVREFQELMAKKFEKKYAYALNSGTSALHLAISALGLKEKDEIIIPALANIADCSVVIQEHAKPIFADINSETFNIDPEDIKRKITPNTKAIIAVHMYGEPADINSIKAIAKKNNLVLIEDCAQAAGARYNKQYVGSFGDISCFSFYQTKHVITGEGGMLLTDSKRWLRIIDSLANNGIKKDNLNAYDYDRLGYNYQMTEIQAALGIAQLKKLDKLNKIRRQNATIYKEQLKDTDIAFQGTSIDTENVYFYLTGLLPEHLVGKREEFLIRTKKKGLPVKNLYPLPLPMMELFKGKMTDDCPIAKNICKRLFNLYVNPGLSEKDIIEFSNIIKKVYRNLER